MCPGFTADCLETLEEIGIEARAAFLAAGGKAFHYIACLNDQHRLDRGAGRDRDAPSAGLAGAAARRGRSSRPSGDAPGSSARRHDGLRTRLAPLHRMNTATKPERAGPRLDKWLWAARLYKTRALAVAEIDKGRVSVNGGAAKPGREMRVGDSVEVRQGPIVRTLDGPGPERSARAGAGGPGALCRDARQHRRARGGARAAAPGPRAVAEHRGRPADQARPAQAGRMVALERERRRRRGLKQIHALKKSRGCRAASRASARRPASGASP